ALSEVARRRLHDQRQLSPGGPRRHRRQSRHVGHRRRNLVQQWGGRRGSPAATAPNANYGGGSYVNCSDSAQHGVETVTKYLAALHPSIKPNCEPGHYYLVNNYNPGYFGDGKNAYTDTNANNYVFTVPPSTVKNIGVELSDAKISWGYFGDQFNRYLADPYGLTYPAQQYCNICNWAQYNTQIMTNETTRTEHLHDTT